LIPSPGAISGAVRTIESGTSIRARVSPHLPALLPGLLVVGLWLAWAADDGGYDPETWYWGALVVLALLAAVVIGLWGRRPRHSRALTAALILFGCYVAWSYASILWAQSPGEALQGSNRALLYLLTFALFTLLPWTARAALSLLLAFAIGIGVIAIVFLVRFAGADHVAPLFILGRLAAPTGYFNSTAALFTMAALVAIVLAANPRLPSLVRGVLIALSCADLQLAVTSQSRGWLLTLPLVAIIAIIVTPDRLRLGMCMLIPVAAALIALRRLLAIYGVHRPVAFNHAVSHAGYRSLLACGIALVVSSVMAIGDRAIPFPRLSPRRRRLVDATVLIAAISAMAAGSLVATHGHPLRFAEAQWRGFARPEAHSTGSGSHFAAVGASRLDIWRAALDAFRAHPIGGLGQDNFANYYLKHRHEIEDPQWTHSLEMRLLAHTGLVGFALFAGFLLAAFIAARRVRREADSEARWIRAAALLPVVVWLLAGSVDWFWEMPALSGPVLGFLGLAVGLRERHRTAGEIGEPRRLVRTPRRGRRSVAIGGLAFAGVAGVVALGLPYLSAREVSIATGVGGRDPVAALQDLSRAASLDPLSAEPGEVAGLIALGRGDMATAEQRFGQAISRDPGSWLPWAGRALAASALGNTGAAYHDFVTARSIDSSQAAIQVGLGRVRSRHPLGPPEGLRLLERGEAPSSPFP
jgi:hypothetical protein